MIEPGKYCGQAVVLRLDVVDQDGRIVGEATPDVFDYISPARLVDAYNERAEFQLWKNRQAVAEAWGEYTPGIWRGKPNKHAVKHHEKDA